MQWNWNTAPVMIGVTLSFMSSSASAQGLCTTPVGQALLPMSFDRILQQLPKPTSAKGEFETTAAYEARAASQNEAASELLMVRPIDSQTYPAPLEYDADSQLLKVRVTAFDWGTTEWALAFASGEPQGPKAGIIFNRATVINRANKVTGTYRASNAYGVTRTVTSIGRTTDSVWSGPARDRNDTLFKGDGDGVIGAISMPPSAAQALKPNIKFALVVAPKSPFLVAGVRPVSAATLSDPRSLNERFRVLIADVRCGVVLDGGNKVLAIYTAS